MLQFVTKYPASRSIADQVKGVIDGGCRWIELSAPGMGEEELRSVAREIIPFCKEVDAIVVTRNHPGLAAELRLHGIFLDYSTGLRVTRERLGGEAIIGVAVDDIAHIKALRTVDVDYVTVAIDSGDTCRRGVEMAAEARREGIKLPIVAEGSFDAEEMAMLLHVGFSGFAVSSQLADADEPSEATASLLRGLTGLM